MSLEDDKTSKTNNVQPGYGGVSQWEAMQQHAMADTKIAGTEGYSLASNETLDKLSADFGKQTDAMGASMDKLSAANASMLKGEIPADVAASVRRAASENSIVKGIGGQAARALSARDLGVTSMDVKQQGIQNEAAVTQARGNLATLQAGFRDSLATRNLAIRQLEDEARTQNLRVIDQERQRVATNISANVNILGYMADLIRTQQTLNVQAAADETDPGGMISSIDNWLKQFSGKLSG